tara:strand:+ start:5247 stop:5702 length:456 start_codon:yes stop_codon:yes gene_type:complete
MKMQNVQKGFTLIELMIVIAIVGILAAIALPAYQDYTVRAKMSEPLATLAEAKTTIAEYYSANGYLPLNGNIAGINGDPDKEIVASIVYDSSSGPLLTARVQEGVIPGGGTGTALEFLLSGVTRSDRSITWKCKPQASGIEPKYLPANCRG